MTTSDQLHDFNFYHIKALKERIKELENEIKHKENIHYNNT